MRNSDGITRARALIVWCVVDESFQIALPPTRAKPYEGASRRCSLGGVRMQLVAGWVEGHAHRSFVLRRPGRC